ncbi:hypothetical protein [Planktothrix agardhii]|uniref:hypothetical protein n=1 Tax=Planktothrix agardhii TaxID=1160 RepID=UPI0020A7D1F8|nr:hypothetical protein [Planktothrix agardhii]CAD5944049.1 hypothetical protein NO365_02110 [Planktothrix agardhii]
MFIQDLSHLEVVTEASNIEGAGGGGHKPPKQPGFALATAYTNASAYGTILANTITDTFTYAGSGQWGSSAGSRSYSQSVAS